MNTDLLTNIGLTGHQSAIYALLLKEGASKAGALDKKTDLKRGLVYKTLDELVALDLVEKIESGSVATFLAKHPSALKEIAQERRKQFAAASTALEQNLGELTSLYNLASGKPGVEFYEGQEGVEKVLLETLRTKDVVYTYADIESIDKNIASVNNSYMKKRLRLGVEKRLLMVDTPYLKTQASRFSDVPYTKTRILKNEDHAPFHTATEIYDDRVAFITFEKGLLTATVITDSAIATMQKYLFELHWDRSQTLHASTTP